MKGRVRPLGVAALVCACLAGTAAFGQLPDQTQSPNTAGKGISKSLDGQKGAGRGDAYTMESSAYIIARDPFRAIRRGRQLFQRKFTRAQGVGPLAQDGVGDIGTNKAIGAGLADSCAACHGRPRGSAGFGGDVATRPDSRDAPHLFGLGLKEMLADEITRDLRLIREMALAEALSRGRRVNRDLVSKGINYGQISAFPDGTVNTSKVKGVNADLRVRPFFAHGGTISIREFVVGALNDEMGLQSPDADLLAASAGARVVTPSGMVLDGAKDAIARPPVNGPGEDGDSDGVTNEIDTSIIDHFEFYLLNYFKPGSGRLTTQTARGRQVMQQVGCTSCHMQNLGIDHDRRVADVETVYDQERGIFNSLFATAAGKFVEVNDNPAYPSWKQPAGAGFLVRDIFTDFKRHDLGPNFWEIEYNGTVQKEFLTTPLWGVGSTPPYGHDGRSMTLRDVILRHGGEAQAARNNFAALSERDAEALIAFLNSLVLFPPDDTASNLDPGEPGALNFPQNGHGSIKLTVLFNDPSDPE